MKLKVTNLNCWITGIISVFLIIPFIVKHFCNMNLWITFLGGYLGGVVTLIGVIITIGNLNNENKKTNEFNKNENSDNQRLSLLPFLIYDFVKTEMPISYREVPLGVDYEEIDINSPRIAYIMNIKNCGLGLAYDITYQLHVEDETSYDTETIIDVVPVSDKTYDKEFVFVLPKFENITDGFNMCLVVFYKDILMNQYVQEIPGYVSINKTDSDEDDITNINFFEPRPLKHISDEISYSFKKTKNSEEKLLEYIEGYSSRYTDSPDENSANEIMAMSESILKLFYEYLLAQAKATFALPHL